MKDDFASKGCEAITGNLHGVLPTDVVLQIIAYVRCVRVSGHLAFCQPFTLVECVAVKVRQISLEQDNYSLQPATERSKRDLSKSFGDATMCLV